MALPRGWDQVFLSQLAAGSEDEPNVLRRLDCGQLAMSVKSLVGGHPPVQRSTWDHLTIQGFTWWHTASGDPPLS